MRSSSCLSKDGIEWTSVQKYLIISKYLVYFSLYIIKIHEIKKEPLQYLNIGVVSKDFILKVIARCAVNNLTNVLTWSANKIAMLTHY